MAHSVYVVTGKVDGKDGPPMHVCEKCGAISVGHAPELPCAADEDGTLTLDHRSNVPAPSRADDAGYYPTDWQEVAGEFEAAYVSTSGVVARARALGDRLRASSEHRVQECGAFIGEALDGTLDEAALTAFLRGRP